MLTGKGTSCIPKNYIEKGRWIFFFFGVIDVLYRKPRIYSALNAVTRLLKLVDRRGAYSKGCLFASNRVFQD